MSNHSNDLPLLCLYLHAFLAAPQSPHCGSGPDSLRGDVLPVAWRCGIGNCFHPLTEALRNCRFRQLLAHEVIADQLVRCYARHTSHALSVARWGGYTTHDNRATRYPSPASTLNHSNPSINDSALLCTHVPSRNNPKRPPWVPTLMCDFLPQKWYAHT